MVIDSRWMVSLNLTISESFSAVKEEVPDNEQEKGMEKEMTERASEDADMV